MTEFSQTHVKLLFFAKSRELAGCKEATEVFPSLISSSKLKTLIINKFNLSSIQDIIILAINQQYITSDEEISLEEGDEIAIIPPLSGG